MAAKLGKKLGATSDINITPLIDILLVLLVIFMVITPLIPSGLDTAVPQPPPPGTPPPPPDEENRTVVVSIDDRNQIMINQDLSDLRTLGTQLQDIFKTRNDRTIFVNADPELLFNDVIQVIDIAKGSGVDKVGLMTEQITADIAGGN
jgi:biopolymer transport protein ExbD